jgi:hypothetical protein
MNATCTPILIAILQDGKVWLSYRLGLADGITLLSRRGIEAEYSAIADDEPAPVVDARPKLDAHRPEIRYYRAVLRYSANEIRMFSNEIVLTLP